MTNAHNLKTKMKQDETSETRFTIVLGSRAAAELVQYAVEQFDGALPDRWPNISFTLPCRITVPNYAAANIEEMCSRHGIAIENIEADCFCKTFICHCRGCAINAFSKRKAA